MTDSQPARGCELKACPFCGGAAIMLPPTCNRDTPYNEADRAFPEVRCIGAVCGGSAHGINWDQSGHSAIAAWNTRVAGGGGVSDAMVERLTIRFFNQTLGIPSWSKTKEGDRQMALQSMRELIGELVAALQVKP